MAPAIPLLMNFCSTSFASERVPASARCTWGASNPGEAVDLVDHDHVDLAGAHVVESKRIWPKHRVVCPPSGAPTSGYRMTQTSRTSILALTCKRCARTRLAGALIAT